MEIEALKDIGLDEQEAKVYLVLLKENLSASEIASETNINRSVTYSILNKLIKKGIVSFIIKNNVKYFKAADPENILTLLKEREKKFREIIPQLKNIKKEKEEKVIVELYQGVEGGKTLLKDIIRTGKDYVVIGEDGSLQEIIPIYIKQYIRQLNEKKIKEKILARPGKKILQSKYSEIRYLPKEFPIPTNTTIYGNKVIIAIYVKPGYTILIKSKELANSYRNFFNILWNISKK